MAADRVGIGFVVDARRVAALVATVMLAATGCGSTSSPAAVSSGPEPSIVSLSPGPSAWPSLRSPEALSPAPSLALVPSQWIEVADFPEPSDQIMGLIGFDAGYVAFGLTLPSGDRGGRTVAWFSVDGREWTASPLPDANEMTGATNGHAVMLTDGRVAWLSTDGRTWSASEPVGSATSDPGARAEIVWATPRGWQALMRSGPLHGGAVSLWETTDGQAWREVGEVADPEGAGVSAAADADGTVLLNIRQGGARGDMALLTSPDGRAWTEISTAAGCEAGYIGLLPPFPAALDRWVVLGQERVCASADLAHWTSASLPTTGTMGISVAAQTRYGILAAGQACWAAGCGPSEPLAWVSANALSWTKLDSQGYIRLIADGPAGVLAIGSRTEDAEQDVVWRLTP
jgi:hypothetical protein